MHEKWYPIYSVFYEGKTWDGARNCSSRASSFDDTGNEPPYATHALRRIDGAPAYSKQCSDAGSLHKKENNGERRQQENFGRVKDEEGNKLLGKSRTRVCAFNVQSLSLSQTILSPGGWAAVDSSPNQPW